MKLASAPAVSETPITLLYARPAGDSSLLDARVAAVARHYPCIRLETMTPDELQRSDYAHLAGPAPAVMLLRKGELVGCAIGSMLPHRELCAAVRNAVEWPDV